MAAGTGFSRSCGIVEDGFGNDNVNSKVEERSQNLNSDQLSQLHASKPPKHLSVVRNSVSTAPLLTPANSVYNSFQSLKLY